MIVRFNLGNRQKHYAIFN